MNSISSSSTNHLFIMQQKRLSPCRQHCCTPYKHTSIDGGPSGDQPCFRVVSAGRSRMRCTSPRLCPFFGWLRLRQPPEFKPFERNVGSGEAREYVHVQTSTRNMCLFSTILSLYIWCCWMRSAGSRQKLNWRYDTFVWTAMTSKWCNKYAI